MVHLKTSSSGGHLKGPIPSAGFNATSISVPSKNKFRGKTWCLGKVPTATLAVGFFLIKYPEKSQV